MNDNIGKYIMLDNELLLSSEASAFFKGTDTREPKDKVSVSQSSFKDDKVVSVYEVLRIIKGKPLFLKDHYERLSLSLKSAGLTWCVSFKEVQSSIISLVEKNIMDEAKGNRDENQYYNCNVRIIYSEGAGIKSSMYYIAKSSYPSENDYNWGVPVGLIQIERSNPNVKQINVKYKDAVTKRIEEQGVFEVLLINHEGYLTEGSRSNLFFIRDGKVYTAPGNLVLLGITRKYVFEACRKAGVEVIETMFTVDDMKSCDGLFISGTSIKALPVSTVEGQNFNSSGLPLMKEIIKRFDEIIYE